MSLTRRRIAGATLGFIVRGFVVAEFAAKSFGGLCAVFQKPRYSVDVRCSSGQYLRAEIVGGTRSRALARAQKSYPDCRVASLMRVRRRHTDHGLI